MIKVDRKNHICELHGESDEILLDVQLVLHKAIRDVAVKNGWDFEASAKTVCSVIADSLIYAEKFIQSQLAKKR